MRTLLSLYRDQIDKIQPPNEFDCRNLLTGRTMHFIAESGVQLTREEKLQLAAEALAEEQAIESQLDFRSRITSRR